MNQSNILSVKFSRSDKNQKVTVAYFYPEQNRHRTEEISDVPHSDFLKAVLDLSPFLAKAFHASDDSMDSYVATGMNIPKDNHVIITGKMSSSTGPIVGIASPAINLDELDSYNEFEDLDGDLNDLVAKLSVETLQLLNGTKVGVRQSTIDDAIEQNKEEDMNQGLFAEGEKENTEGKDDEEDDGLSELENLPDELDNNAPGNDDFVFPDDLDKK